jgi:hypothetical protein
MQIAGFFVLLHLLTDARLLAPVKVEQRYAC